MSGAEYVELARALPQDGFATAHAGHFLVKRPKVDVEEAGPEFAGFGFATNVTETDFDPWASEWQVLPVAKRPGNPFPDRITVGRATNCDVVVRLPSVSKVHAHIVRGADGTFVLHDNRPSNAIMINGNALPPGHSQTLELGDRVRIGTLEFEFVDAARLHDIANGEA
jgi:hypothetical protein